MSADIWLENEDGTQVTVDEDVDAEMRSMVLMRSSASVDSTTFSLTYNLTPMLRAAGMPAWDGMIGMKASEAGRIWRAVHTTLRCSPVYFERFNPANGWGDYGGCVEVIGALADACERFPDAKVGGWL